MNFITPVSVSSAARNAKNSTPQVRKSEAVLKCGEESSRLDAGTWRRLMDAFSCAVIIQRI
jgi:hypothetical protein